MDDIVDQYFDGLTTYNSDLYATIREGNLSTLVYNVTHNSSKKHHDYRKPSELWTPSRQVLQHLNYDNNIVEGMSLNEVSKSHPPAHYESYEVFNRSLQLRLQRRGPLLGVVPNLWYRYISPSGYDANKLAWTTQVDSNRAVRCFQGYSFFLDESSYTRCIRLGNGWKDSNGTNKQLNFSISGTRQPLSRAQLPGLNFTVTFSDKITFFKGKQPPQWLPTPCLSNLVSGNTSSNVSCDWDRFFSLDISENEHMKRSTHANTWEVYAANDQSVPALTVDFTAYVNFTDYVLDPSPLTNPLGLVQTSNVPAGGVPVVIDPSWALLAWSADANGDIPSNRTTTMQMINGVAYNETYQYYDAAPLTMQLTVLHMLTLLRFSTVDEDQAPVINTEHPHLKRSGTIFVYAYSLSSRTSKLGVVVAIAGMVVVLANAFMGLFFHRPRKSITQIVAAALEHPPQGEFDHARSESEVVKTRFKVDHVEHGAGELRFRKES